MQNGKDLKMLEQLREEILACRLCEEKFGFEPHPVMTGNANAKIMQISQAPSQNVHKTLKPFDDLSGKKLRNDWYCIPDEVFYNPNNFYITSIAHCYPGKSPSKGDRQPPKSCAKKWLKREMDSVQNDIYILLGGKAAEYFFPKHDFSSLVFEDQEINGKPAYILPHPSPLNVKWFKDNPHFLDVRVKEIRGIVHEILGV